MACLLVAGLFFCRYYGVQIQRHLALIAAGLGFHSIIQAADNMFLEHWRNNWINSFTVWEALRHFSFEIALMLWVAALWKPVPAAPPVPALLGSDKYAELGPQVTTRLRELNTRLLEMWK